MVLHGDLDQDRRGWSRPDEEVPARQQGLGHRLEAVDQEVQDHLLKLHPVADDARQIRLELGWNRTCRRMASEATRRSTSWVISLRSSRLDVQLTLPQQGPHPADDLAGPHVVGGDVVEDLAQQLGLGG